MFTKSGVPMERDLPPPDFSTSSTSLLESVRASISSSWDRDLALPFELDSDFIFCNSLLIARARGVSVVVGAGSLVCVVKVRSSVVSIEDKVGLVVVSVNIVDTDTGGITGVGDFVTLGGLVVAVVVVVVVVVVVAVVIRLLG